MIMLLIIRFIFNIYKATKVNSKGKITRKLESKI